MAKDTFKNLPEEKRERILKSAATLFAITGFMKTDVAQIAKSAGVAKGSMYNYFSTKDEIYMDVALSGLEHSRKAVYGGLHPDWDVYRQIDHMFRKGAEFAAKYPEYVLVYMNVSSVGMERFAEELSREVEKYTSDHLKRVIRDGIEKGLVRSDLNVNMTAFSINGLYILFLFSLVSRHFEIRLMEYLEIEGEVEDADRERILEQLIGMITSLLRPAESRAGAMESQGGD